MTDLTRLSVSLTKHGAHKIALLLKAFESDVILYKLDEAISGVHIDEAQARKNLSIQNGDRVPAVWGEVKRLGDDAIDALVLVAVIFSHYDLIRAMMDASSPSQFSGRIERNVQLEGKAYTNFSHILDQLGYATTVDSGGVSYDLRPVFGVLGLGRLAGQLIELKLVSAGWDKSNTLAQEVERLELHNVFHIDLADLVSWLVASEPPRSSAAVLLAKDASFFSSEAEEEERGEFEFKPGHVTRAIQSVAVAGSKKAIAARLHNDIQNKLYAYLCNKIGASNVGTEVSTGSGTSIDVVARQAGTFTFYEIKTSSSIRTNIRQALPQLLEYSFWPDEVRAKKLVIVAHLPPTSESVRYLEHIRNRFRIPLYYEQFDVELKALV